MFKINSNDENLQKAVSQLFKWYDKYLMDEELKKVLEKLRDIKPNTLTENEGRYLIDAYETFRDIMETFGEINEMLDDID